jgi:glutamate/tyrosine decarboxylase-like PLP-dependent enzyme
VLQQATAAGEHDTEYLFHGGEDAELDTGRASLQCGRRVDALKLWLMWKRHGDEGLAARVDHLFELADLARALVERHPRLELVARGQAPNVCFRWLPADGRDADAFTLALRERLRRSGRALVNYAGVDGRQAIRLTLSNADLARADVEEFFARLAQAAEQLEREAAVPAPAASGACAGEPTSTC